MGRDHINRVELFGRLATDPELREFDSGTRLLRLLVAVNVDQPRRRVDVVPVTLWDPPVDLVQAGLTKGEEVSISGTIQRRYWESPDGRRSRLEVVATSVAVDQPTLSVRTDRGRHRETRSSTGLEL